MSKIIFEDEYVIGVPTFAETTSHKHDFYHIFFLGNKEYKHVDKKINEIASEFNISESRLSHMFKENVGISLKGYKR